MEQCTADLETIRQIAQEHGYNNRSTGQERRFWLKLQDYLSQRQQQFHYSLLPDDWGTRILEDLSALSLEARAPWLALLQHCALAKTPTPSPQWQQQAQTLLSALDSDTFMPTLHRWVRFFSDKKGGRMDGTNLNILRGLLWLCMGHSDRFLAALLADTAIEGYRKLSGLGPRSPKVGDAAVISLQGMRGRDAIGQLERVRRAVKQPSYQAKIERTLDAIAQREQMSRLDLEELTVPTFDLHEGQLQVPLAPWTARLYVEGKGVQRQWLDPEGNQHDALPASIRRAAKEELKTLTRLVTDMNYLLSDQRQRLERLFLHERHWSLADWRERYLDHPLLHVLARRLIWQVRHDTQCWRVIWHQGQLVTSDTQAVELPPEAQVTLWHPLMSDSQEVEGWCLWLEAHRVTQPFKQAHRETYPITDAERTAHNVSLRFANHYIRQHQLNALARARGWSFVLQSDFSGSVQDDPVRFDLPHLGIRAEFALNPLPGEDEAIPQYLLTSHVRFPLFASSNGSKQLLPLAHVPPLVFSEIMRDIDLFVSVTSLGADPYGYTQTGPLLDYWQAYNQETLSLSAQRRKQILERLVPQLEIRERCTLEDHYLHVRGDVRTYRIHLGSANILMEPGPQYLCIVFDTSAKADSDEPFFLPFEGDLVLALILSKAFLLADDTHIKDQSILSQIRSR
ncbi:hypothetical protein KSD_04430 [Ktedonobacter sp. SOSP1-85]|uniref:DUF4132 domain-containing protein n=1 Tax=Ktedonobacter sp. SOSP1-85 TaxID=2778367 RepID=UPI001916A709|nr:DUF4132 domain-containing protein [Ktedonobacter sp. SOSP1-85]GHO72672.1 hypothetical protein KSD_04430 [Ktedonobacter sp. SOSP1-85]